MVRKRAYIQEAVALQRLVTVMVAAAKSAKNQGDPLDRRTNLAHVAASLPTTVSLSGSRAKGDPCEWSTGMTEIPKAPANKPIKDLGGTIALSPSQLFALPPKR